jgi:hypothetical protein
VLDVGPDEDIWLEVVVNANIELLMDDAAVEDVEDD